jgi:Peptidase family M28
VPLPATTPDDLDRAIATIAELAEDIGPRRPTGPGERAAAAALVNRLRNEGVEARTESFRGYSTFATPFAIVLGAAVLPLLLRRGLSRILASWLAAAGLITEGSLRWAPLTRALSRRPSSNVVAAIEPSGEAQRTLCLVAHMDTSRSGLIFAPGLVGWMPAWIAASSGLVLLQALLEPFAGASRRVRAALLAIRSGLLGSLGLLAERELRGVDVRGANDNASGCGIVCSLAARLRTDPLESTRVVILITGCEESGTLGARAFRDSHDTEGWLFVNFDNVGGPGTVRFLRREGVIDKWDADPGLIAAAAEVAAARPELRMAPEDAPAGLTYDSSPIHAAGGRALTISVQDGSIPDLHQPSDVFANVSRDGVRRTLEAGAELVAAIDRGAAD